MLLSIRPALYSDVFNLLQVLFPSQSCWVTAQSVVSPPAPVSSSAPLLEQRSRARLMGRGCEGAKMEASASKKSQAF